MSALTTTLDARGVASLILNRPEVHNAFDDALIEELNTAIDRFRADPHVRILVVRAEGKSFSAGADLAWMKRMAACSEEDNLADAQELERLMHGLHAFPKPTLAIVQGAAFGGAVGLISCCDIAIASDNASFSLSEVKLGLAPAVISPFVIAAIGPRQASRYFLTAERFSASRALEMELLHEVVVPDQLQATADTLIQALLNNGPEAMTASKALIRHVVPSTDDELRDYTTSLIARLRTSTEGQEGLSAFFEKRAPAWQHRKN